MGLIGVMGLPTLLRGNFYQAQNHAYVSGCRLWLINGLGGGMMRLTRTTSRLKIAMSVLLRWMMMTSLLVRLPCPYDFHGRTLFVTAAPLTASNATFAKICCSVKAANILVIVSNYFLNKQHGKGAPGHKCVHGSWWCQNGACVACSS